MFVCLFVCLFVCFFVCLYVAVLFFVKGSLIQFREVQLLQFLCVCLFVCRSFAFFPGDCMFGAVLFVKC